LTEPLLSCRHVWKLYGGDPKAFLSKHEGKPDLAAIKEGGYIPAVRDTSIDVFPGEIVIIMGSRDQASRRWCAAYHGSSNRPPARFSSKAKTF
jgi:hypothetical protein